MDFVGQLNHKVWSAKPQSLVS